MLETMTAEGSLAMDMAPPVTRSAQKSRRKSQPGSPLLPCLTATYSVGTVSAA